MASADNNEHHDGDALNKKARAWNWENPQSPLLWVVFASTSLLSARHILVESNFHYPVLVYLAQLFMTTIVVTIQIPWRDKARRHSSGRPSPRRIRRGTLLALGAVSFTALSMLCMLQAILHFTNLPTLVMLVTVALFADDLSHVLFDYASRSRAELLRVSLLLMACVGILTTEYRLTVPALITSIPAMLFAGLASALRKCAFERHPREEMPDRIQQLQWLVVSGYIIAAVWVLLFWPEKKAVMFEWRHLLLLGINATATTVALLVGQSMLLPKFELDTTAALRSDDGFSLTGDTWVILALVGITGCHSTLSVRRSYTNWYQLSCFAIAVLCVASKRVHNPKYSRVSRSHNRSITYEPLHTPFATLDREEADVPKDLEKMGEPRHLRRVIRLPSYGSVRLAVVMLSVWLAYTYLNFFTPNHAEPHALDREYIPVLPLEIVISMYKEPIEDVRELIIRLKAVSQTPEASVVIYNKDPGVEVETLQSHTGADKVIKLPNVGREGETYLFHIRDQWDHLAKHTVFLQADIHNPREFYARLRNYFDSNRTGFLSLGWSDVCTCENCGDRFSWHDTAGLFPWYHNKINNGAECKNALLSYKGQFIVSGARIRGISRTMYDELWHNFVNADSWAHKPENLEGRPDFMSAPDFGYTMERMWSLLFQCSSMDVAWKCPTLLSAWRLGGDIEDCQCFDSALSSEGS